MALCCCHNLIVLCCHWLPVPSVHLIVVCFSIFFVLLRQKNIEALRVNCFQNSLLLFGLIFCFPKCAMMHWPWRWKVVLWWTKQSVMKLSVTVVTWMSWYPMRLGNSTKSLLKSIRSGFITVNYSCFSRDDLLFCSMVLLHVNFVCLLYNFIYLRTELSDSFFLQIDFVAHDDLPYGYAGQDDLYKWLKDSGRWLSDDTFDFFWTLLF